MMFRRLCLMLLVAAAAGCKSEEPEPATFPDIHFSVEAPIRLDVSGIDIVASFKPSFHPPEVEQNFPVPPQRAIENWVHDRLLAANPASINRLRVTILDASARETPSPPQKDTDTRYDARAEVRVEVVDARGFTIRSATAVATRSRTQPSGGTLNETDAIWYAMTKDLTHDLAQELERQITGTFGPQLL